MTLRGGGAASSRDVTVSDAELARYAPDDADPEHLVRNAFAFLLARESSESILRRFAVSEIERYFPEFGREMRLATPGVTRSDMQGSREA